MNNFLLKYKVENHYAIMAIVFAVLLGLGLGFNSIEADKNDEIKKIHYVHLEDGVCDFEPNPYEIPNGWCPNDYQITFIRDENINFNSVISITAPLDGTECNVRTLTENVGFYLTCNADNGSPLNYVIMNP